MRHGITSKRRFRALRRATHVFLCLVILFGGLLDGLSHSAHAHPGHQHDGPGLTAVDGHTVECAHSEDDPHASTNGVNHDSCSDITASIQTESRGGEKGDCRGDCCVHVCMVGVMHNDTTALWNPGSKSQLALRQSIHPSQDKTLPFRPPIFSL